MMWYGVSRLHVSAGIRWLMLIGAWICLGIVFHPQKVRLCKLKFRRFLSFALVVIVIVSMCCFGSFRHRWKGLMLLEELSKDTGLWCSIRGF